LTLATTLTSAASQARCQIYQWAMSGGKVVQSSALCPGGSGVSAVPDANLSFLDLTQAYLINANLTNANLYGTTLTNANLTNANLTSADAQDATLTGAKLTGATVAGASFVITNLTASQLYSTASYQAKNLQGINLADDDFTRWNFSQQNLAGANFNSATLANTNLTNANLTYAGFSAADMTNANLTGATVVGAQFEWGNFTASQLYSTASYKAYNLQGVGLAGDNLAGWNFSGQNVTNADFHYTNFTSAQLYSTASYKALNLQGVDLGQNDLTGWNFSAQNLTNANLYESTLANASLTGATVAGADFDSANPTASQIYSTASYQAHSLPGIVMNFDNMTGWDFSGQNLAAATLFGSTLTNANLTNANLSGAMLGNTSFTGADLRGATGFSGTPSGATTTNTILSNGVVQGLTLSATNPTLIVRNYSGGIPIHVEQGMTINSGTSLAIQLDGNPWGSTISFDPGIPITLAGNLALGVAAGVNSSALIGKTFQLFNWAGVTPSGQLGVIDDLGSSCLVDASQLYTTGNVKILDHSNASLSPTVSQVAETINFGNVLRGAAVPSQGFTIYNRAANTLAAYTANLKLTTGFTATGDPALSTNLSTFGGLAAGSGNTFTTSLNTGNYTTTGINTVTMSASQLADDSTLPGAGSNNNGAITVTLQGNVGNATADKSNSQNSFGTALTAPVAPNGSYANLDSKVTATSGSGGYGMIGSEATILEGTNTSGSAQTVTMQWRTQTQAERKSPELISDVVRLSGMALDGTSQTSPFVLQMNYNPSLLPLGAGSEGLLASKQQIYLAWLDPGDGKWENAILGNIGTNLGGFYLRAWVPGDMTLGDWGVNTANHTVWAVLDHNSDFAVVPEPSMLGLLAAGGIGWMAAAWRRRRRKPRLSLTREPAASDLLPAVGEEDAAPILSLPLRWEVPARRAA
jgi:uncharacterized protein YjbI with pentapeptide repeats